MPVTPDDRTGSRGRMASMFRTARWSVATRLIVLVLAAVVPLNAVILAVIWQLQAAASEAQRNTLLYSARTVAMAVDSQLEKNEALGQALARSPSALDDDLTAFAAEARRMVPPTADAWVVVFDARGQMLLNLADPSQPRQMRRPEGLASQQRAYASGTPGVSDVFHGAIRDWIATIDVPVLKDGQPFRVLSVTMDAALFLTLLSEQQLPANWLAGIVDSQGRFIARVPHNAARVGQPASEGWRTLMARDGVFNNKSLEGDDTVLANVRAAGGRWAVGIAVKRSELNAAAWSAVRQAMLGGGLLSLLSLVLALLMTRRIVRPLTALREHAEALIDGRMPELPPSVPEVRAVWQSLQRVVSARNRADDALRALAERFTAAEQAAGGLVYDWDVIADTVWRSDGIQALLGYTPGTLRPTGAAWLALVHPDDVLGFSAPLDTLLDREDRYSNEYRVRHRDGTYVWVWDRGRAVRAADGTVLRLVGATIDITARKQIEVQLAESEERLRLASEAAGFGIHDFDVARQDSFWSPQMCRIFGLEPQARVPVATALSIIHPDDRERVRQHIQATATRVGQFEIEFRIIRPDGSTGWVFDRGNALGPIDPATGRVRRIMGTMIDITARRNAENALTELTHTLETRVREEIASREAAQARAAHAERIQALGQLAGGIAHDLNNVLQVVEGGARLIQKKAEAPKDVARFSRMILEATARGAAVTNRLLAFARRGELRAEPVELSALFVELLEILTPALGSPVAIRLDLAADLPPVLADKAQLETVLINLATNARDAMPQGGVLRLGADTLTVDDGAVHPVGLRPGAYVRLFVTDTGVGMDKDTLMRAMEPFFTTKPSGKGTGLGLPMAKGFAEQSGGALHVGSEPQKGTTVSLWIPQQSDIAPPAPPDATPTDSLAPVRRILLVDDDLPVRQVLAEQLAGAGYRIITASNGLDALLQLDERGDIDIVVSDYAMPGGLNGFDTLREIRGRWPHLVTVLLTGYAELGVVPTPGDAADFILLRKPVSGQQLMAAIATRLAERDATAAMATADTP